MLDKIKALFAWRTVFRSGCYAYQENGVTGKRRLVRTTSGGHSPYDEDWLMGLPEGSSFGSPSTGGSAVIKG